MGAFDLPHTYTYINDIGQALIVLGEREEALGQVWHAPNAETLTQRQFLDLVFEEISRPPKMSAMGRGMLRIGGLFIPEARETIEMLYEFEQPFIVDDRKYREAFGGQPTPLRTAIRETVAWYREYSGNS
jgi:nucleoside-diphosphate-sugar epimerase